MPTRARDLRVPFEGEPGPLNAVTDVAGVEVGHSTIIRGDGPLVIDDGPVRTGVTVVFPRGRDGIMAPCFAGYHGLNPWGELTGIQRLEGQGLMGGPMATTNSMSVGLARDTIARWLTDGQDNERMMQLMGQSIRVVGETHDGFLNDIVGQHIKPEHVIEALEGARSGAVVEGSVGGGTGMMAYEFKAGIGTASRVVEAGPGSWTLGVIVQANHGLRRDLTIAGVPVGRELEGGWLERESGSIIGTCVTDAPLLSPQLKRIAQRVGLGVARTGAIGRNNSGDMFLALSTANPETWSDTEGLRHASFLHDAHIDALFEAAVQAAEEAVINSLFASDTMVGIDGNTAPGLPHEAVVEILTRFGRHKGLTLSG
ncbi:MAG: P1 family peptidase [Alphaproteobacteria bacterium]|jgi:D-aminopeptidase|nr:S58 family peptidase [Rhodospirillaceae bacterium]MBT6204598.1 S58 family peptidase [Rhodospirillaceae bacterium]MBT6510316.1 S58 family peptidase [Rhodospirillaceae bacterium]MDG2479620.1 P1 family peptidase [Alphaproteobacteria bacterium]